MENKRKSGKGKEDEKLGTKRKRNEKVKKKLTQLGSKIICIYALHISLDEV